MIAGNKNKEKASSVTPTTAETETPADRGKLQTQTNILHALTPTVPRWLKTTRSICTSHAGLRDGVACVYRAAG